MMRFTTFITLLLAASMALGATRIGSWTVVNQSTDPFSTTITVPSGAQLGVFANCLYDSTTPAPTSFTLDGDNLSLATRATSDVGEQTGIWTITSAQGLTAGAGQTLTFDHAGAIEEGMHMFYVFFQDVDSGTPITVLGTANSGGDPGTVSTSSATADTGDIAVGVGCVFGGAGVALNGEVLDDVEFNSNDGAVGEVAGSGASASFTVTSGRFPSVSGIIVENAAGGGGGVVDVLTLQNLGKGFGPHKSQELGGHLEGQ